MRSRRFLHSVLLALACAAPAGRADWATTAGYGALAEMTVESRHIRLKLKVLESALPRLAHLAGSTAEAPEMDRLTLQLLELRVGSGKPLEAQAAVRVENQELDDAAARAPGAGFREAAVEFATPAPIDSLTIKPPAGSGGRDIALVALDRGVPVSDPIGLQKPVRLTIDPANPWQSRFDDPAFRRRHAEPRSFLYVESFEVRHELLIRLTDLAGRVDLGLRNPRFIEPDERAAAAGKIGAYLLARNPLRIDGISVQPQLDRVEFVGFSASGIQPVSESERLSASAALMGVMLSVLTDRPARELVLTWEVFSENLATRPVSVVMGAETFDSDATRQNPTVEWSRDEALNSQDEAEAKPPSQLTEALQNETVAPVLEALLHNAYRAFPLRSEEAAYDRLAKSLDGELLEDIYLQQRKALLRQTDGLGGEGKVDRIEIRDAFIRATSNHPPSHDVFAQWIAHGTVSHWGHSHPRQNLYSARLSLRPGVDGAWRIARMNFESGARLEDGSRP